MSKINERMDSLKLEIMVHGTQIWSESTVTKLKQRLQKILVENEYLDSADADHSNPVLSSPLVENAIRVGACTSGLHLPD